MWLKSLGQVGYHKDIFSKHDKMLCTGCSYLYSSMLLMIICAYQGKPFGNIEILAGKSTKSSGKANKVILVGNCRIKANRKFPTIKEAVLAKGCPRPLRRLQRPLNNVAYMLI